MTSLPPVRSYAGVVHRVVRSTAARRQYFGTYFFRNRPQLNVVRRLVDQWSTGATLKIAVLACSNGAEAYSILWTIRAARPDLHVVAQAVDISQDVVALAARGVYSVHAPELVGAPIFERMNDDERRQMFDVDRTRQVASIKAWLRDAITWHVGDAASPQMARLLGPQDMVVANNFLCHMRPAEAERCLRTIARVVAPGGYLLVSGIDLDVRTRVALDLGWTPVPDLMEDIHEGDPSLRRDWPVEYWGLEPFDRRRRDWHVRYAAIFRLGAAAARERELTERAR